MLCLLSISSEIHRQSRLFWQRERIVILRVGGQENKKNCSAKVGSYFNCDENTGMATAEHVPLRPIFITFLHNISLDWRKIVFNQREEQWQRLPDKFHTCMFEYWALCNAISQTDSWRLLRNESLRIYRTKHFSFLSFCQGVGNICARESAPLKSAKEVCNERRGMRRCVIFVEIA